MHSANHANCKCYKPIMDLKKRDKLGKGTISYLPSMECNVRDMQKPSNVSTCRISDSDAARVNLSPEQSSALQEYVTNRAVDMFPFIIVCD